MNRSNYQWLFLIGAAFISISCQKNSNQDGSKNSTSAYESWYAYGGDSGGNRYVPADQITPENINDLVVAWRYRTGELGQNSTIKEKLTFEATPIHFKGRLYLSTAYGKVIALHPSTGQEIWTYDPKIDRTTSFSELTSRGVSAWTDTALSTGAPCKDCIIIGTINAKLIKLSLIHI